MERYGECSHGEITIFQKPSPLHASPELTLINPNTPSVCVITFINLWLFGLSLSLKIFNILPPCSLQYIIEHSGISRSQ